MSDRIINIFLTHRHDQTSFARGDEKTNFTLNKEADLPIDSAAQHIFQKSDLDRMGFRKGSDESCIGPIK